MSQTDAVSPTFLSRLSANITYWRQVTDDYSDADIPALNPDYPNLRRAVQMGLSHPSTRRETAVLLCNTFFWVEQAGHWDNWLPLIEKSISLLDDPNLLCRLYKQKGQLHRAQKQFDAALTALTHSAMLADQLHDNLALAEAQTHLCSIYYQKHAYNRAKTAAKEALNLLSNYPDAHHQWASALTNLGLVNMSLGNLAQSEKELLNAVEFGRLLQQPTQLARMLNTLAIVLHRQEKHAASKQAFEEAIEIIKPTASRLDKVQLELSLGALLFDMNCLDEAETLFLQADKAVQTMPGQLHLRAMIANNLGNVLLEKNQPAAAEHYLQRSVNLRRQLNIQLPLANSYKGLAQAHYQQQQMKPALAAIDAALAILPAFTNSAWANKLSQECQILRSKILA